MSISSQSVLNHSRRINSPTMDSNDHWISVSDLMTGLMMVFLFVAIVFMVDVEIEKNKIREVAVLYDDLRNELYHDLLAEFVDDMPAWGAELDKDLVFRFNNTELLFAKGDASINTAFQSILNDFFPRYLSIIRSPKYKDDIIEVRIEGHTSRGWHRAVSNDEAYIKNMDLSQARTRSTLAHIFQIVSKPQDKDWLRSHVMATGLSYSKPVLDKLGKEDPLQSRRVEFRVRTDAEGRIAEILSNHL